MPSLRRGLLFTLIVVAALAVTRPASAHPLGNFTVNQYSGIVVGPDRITIDYVLDLAEIPTFQARPSVDTDGNGSISAGERRAYASSSCASVASHLALRAAGAPIAVIVASTAAAFPPGQAGLATTRVTCGFTAPFTGGAITYANENFPDRVGWREITVAGDRATVTGSPVATSSSSDRLRHYPKGALSSPPDDRSVAFHAEPGGPALARPVTHAARPGHEARGIDGATVAFTNFVGRHDLTVPVAMVAFVLALLLGAIHAFAPGHGKTVMAAYLVGRHGSLRHASIIAVTVTATHTAGVLVLGILISASAVVAPERLYPWLGAISGGLLLLIGVAMLRSGRRGSRLAAAVAQHHHDDHDHHHGHQHGGHWHTHAPPDPGLRTGALLAMGFVGGLLPSPSALVVLLGAIALHRAWFGVILVAAYGAGMALTLTGAGLLLVRGRAAIDRRLQVGRRLPALLALERTLPVLTGAVVVVVGIVLTTRGVLAIH